MKEFNDNEMFCIKCLLHDTFWSGGNSWGIDSCPKCGSQETILYKNMNFRQRILAKQLFDEWRQKTRVSKD